MPHLPTGSIAPDFTLLDHQGQPFTLSEALRNGPVVLYFYPKDNTYGCIREACFFRDAYEDFIDVGAQVVGVSADSITSHQEFRDQYNLPFTLLSDPDRLAHTLYGVDRFMFGLLASRITYIISKEGRILGIIDSVIDFQGHVTKGLSMLRRQVLAP